MIKEFIHKIVLMDVFNGIDKCTDPVNTGCIPPGKEDIATLISNITNIALALIGTLSLLFLIIGGIQYMTSGGNPDSVSKAKNTIFYAIIGLVLSITSWAIVTFMIGAF